MRKTLLVALAALLTIMFPAAAQAMTALTGSSGTNVTLNSNANSPNYGNANEAYFFRAKNANSPNPGFTNGTVQLNDTAVLVQAFVANDSGSGSLARNTVLTITLPTSYTTSQVVTATISANNAGSLTD